MKIIIELEQRELQAANELINTLKSLTDQLQLRSANTMGAEQAVSVSMAEHSREAATPGVPPQQHAYDAVQAVIPGIVHTMPANVPSAMPSNGSYALADQDKRSTCRSILLNLTDHNQVDAVSASLANYLQSRTDAQEAMMELVDAFESVVFPQQHVPGTPVDTDRVERYFQLLAHKLPEKLDTEFRKGVLQRVLKQLTKGRDLTCDRGQLVPYAVGFAALARLECVKMSGALATIERLISKAHSCAAAVTMLGQVLSTCSQLVWTAPQELSSVWQQVDSVPELRSPVFAHDMEFLAAWRAHAQAHGEPPINMRYNPLPTTSSAMYAMPPAGGQQQGGAHQMSGGQALVLTANNYLPLKTPGVCMVWDAPSNTAVVSGADSSVISWHVASGRDLSRLEVAGYPPVTCMSSHPTKGMLLLAANPAQQQQHTAPYLALHDTSSGMQRRGVAMRQSNSIVTRTLLLPGETDVAVSCESWGGMSPNHAYAVCLWDINRLESGPSHSWTDGHSGGVTCGTYCASMNCTFFTGGQDGMVCIWDTRLRSSAGSLGVMDSHGGRGKAHTGSVMCMDNQGHMLLTAGADSTVCMWDLRQLSSSNNPASIAPMLNMVVESHGVPVYKLAYRDSPTPTTAAVATASGLYLLDWTAHEKPTMIPTPNFHGNVSAGLLPHDITWAPGAAPGGGLALLALNGQASLTMFSLQSASI